MLSNRRDISKNGTKSLPYSEHAIYSSAHGGSIYNHQTNPKRMETKLIFTLLSALGVTSYIGAIILNIGTWKADILWCIACMFGIVKFIRYSLKTWQDFRKGELEIKKIKRQENN